MCIRDRSYTPGSSEISLTQPASPYGAAYAPGNGYNGQLVQDESANLGNQLELIASTSVSATSGGYQVSLLSFFQ